MESSVFHFSTLLMRNRVGGDPDITNQESQCEGVTVGSRDLTVRVWPYSMGDTGKCEPLASTGHTLDGEGFIVLPQASCKLYTDFSSSPGSQWSLNISFFLSFSRFYHSCYSNS